MKTIKNQNISVALDWPNKFYLKRFFEKIMQRRQKNKCQKFHMNNLNKYLKLLRTSSRNVPKVVVI